jgi:hypothetical protein
MATLVYLLPMLALVALAVIGLGCGIWAIARDERPTAVRALLIVLGIAATAILVLILLAYSALSNDTS